MHSPLIIGIPAGTAGYVVAIDRQSGAEIWRTQLTVSKFLGPGPVNLLVEDGFIFAGLCGHLFCLDLQTGREVWRNDLQGLGYGPIAFASDRMTQGVEQQLP